MKFFSYKRLAIAAAVILFILFPLRPGVSRLKMRIADSIGRAVARRVEIGSVNLRFLPPGFDLKNLTIYEDPAFGEEPMLRAREVTAVVRLASLARGRLDISRLELTEPSLNLVHKDNGRWNLEALLEHAARIPLAPTGKSKSEARPEFPYIEANAGRINFKAGTEKKPYALLNADFALWQESDNAWGVRLKAEPARTDMGLGDIGVLRLTGTWQRAGSLHDTPLQFSATWERAQLGLLTKFVTGSDKGWRGEVRWDAALSGTPANLRVAADTTVRNFHRYDIAGGSEVRLAAHCDARYRSSDAMLHEILCSAPVGDGMLSLHGQVGLLGTHNLDVSLQAENLPANAVEHLARRAKKDLPADLTAGGSMEGSLTIKQDGPLAEIEYKGSGEILNLRLGSAYSKSALSVERIPFAISSARIDRVKRTDPNRSHPFEVETSAVPEGFLLEYGPFPVALGHTPAAEAWGWLARSGYAINIRGDGEIAHALRAASLVGLPVLKANIEGAAQMDLRMTGAWAQDSSPSASGFSLPPVTGIVQLHNVSARIRGTNGPLEILSGELRLQPREVRAEKLNLRAANSHWTASLSMPRSCGVAGVCLVHFRLNSEEVGLRDIAGWWSAPADGRKWYDVLASAVPAKPSFLDNLRASGTINVARLVLHQVVAEHASAALDLERGKMKVSNIRAGLLGGKHNGEWHADFTVTPPVYSGSGTLSSVSLHQIAEAMHDSWISGSATVSYDLTASGADSAAFWRSAAGAIKFDLRDGTLSHIFLSDEEYPLQVARWQGDAHLKDGVFEVRDAKLLSYDAKYASSGTVSLGQMLDLRLVKDFALTAAPATATVYRITGSLAQPHVAVTLTPETQAQLKP